MVIPKLIGRLGNQAFQIAAAIGYASKHNISYCIPKQTIAPHVWPNYFEHLATCPDTQLRNPVIIKEVEHAYQELPAPSGNFDYVLEGYWQSEKYFSHCKSEIISTFNLSQPSINKGWVAIHKRLGDYKLYPTKHPIISDDYLKRSIEYFWAKGYYKFVVFSDEIEECMQTINDIKFTKGIFEYSMTTDPIKAIKEMTSFEHFIISASSFSWWGAWLCLNPYKIVIAPKEWFGIDNAHLDSRDVCPENWLRF